jgi:hypothetical protein
VTAAIFWLKTRGGWRETPKEEPAKADADLSKLTDAELEEMIAVLQKTVGEQEKLPTPSPEQERDDRSSPPDHYH